jgi:hypothetical protein
MGVKVKNGSYYLLADWAATDKLVPQMQLAANR